MYNIRHACINLTDKVVNFERSFVVRGGAQVEQGGAQPMHSPVSHWRQAASAEWLQPLPPHIKQATQHTQPFSSNYTTSWILGRATPQIIAPLLASPLPVAHALGKANMANQGNLRPIANN